MSKNSSPSNYLFDQRHSLERIWAIDIDIDPLIIRARELHKQGRHEFALSMEQEILPVI